LFPKSKRKRNRTLEQLDAQRVSGLHSLGIWAILGELNHNLSAVDNFSLRTSKINKANRLAFPPPSVPRQHTYTEQKRNLVILRSYNQSENTKLKTETTSVCGREKERKRDLRSLGIKTSTTLPYLSKRGKRSSAVVPRKKTKSTH